MRAMQAAESMVSTYCAMGASIEEADAIVAALLRAQENMLKMGYQYGRKDGHGEHNECIERGECTCR